MYDSDFWYVCPILFIPATLIWVVLDSFFDRFSFVEKIVKKFGWNHSTAKKWAHIFSGIISHLLTILTEIIISILIGFNLFSWEWM